MAVTQLNVRMDKTLKREGDLAFSRAGCSSTRAVRALWEFARRNVDQPSQLRALVRQLEGIGADDEASVATQEDAAEKANKERNDLYERIGIPLPVVFGELGSAVRDDALQKQVDEDRVALTHAYAERLAERGL